MKDEEKRRLNFGVNHYLGGDVSLFRKFRIGKTRYFQTSTNQIVRL